MIPDTTGTTIRAPFGTPKEELEARALADEKVQPFLAGKQVANTSPGDDAVGRNFSKRQENKCAFEPMRMWQRQIRLAQHENAGAIDVEQRGDLGEHAFRQALHGSEVEQRGSGFDDDLEPAAGLDENESGELARLIRRLADERNMGVLLVEHDVSLVMSTCDRVVVIDFGRVIAEVGAAAAVQQHIGGVAAGVKEEADVVPPLAPELGQDEREEGVPIGRDRSSIGRQRCQLVRMGE